MDILQSGNEETQRIIKEDLKEDEDRLRNNLRLFEDWMEHQNHLPKNYDRRMLEIFLRGSKHDLAKAQRKLEMYFIAKATIPEIFFNRNPESKDMIDIQKVADVAIIPQLSPEGYRVTINNIRVKDPSKFNIDLLIKRGSLSTCLRTVLEKPIAGDFLIFDSKNLTAAHAGLIITPAVKKVLSIGPEGYPNRIRQIHIVNTSPIVEKIVNFIKTVLKEKLRKRVFVHADAEALQRFLPKHCLPEEYGGTAGSLEELSLRTHGFCTANAGWFRRQEDVRLEGPPPGRYGTAGKDEFGAGPDGSFRQLRID